MSLTVADGTLVQKDPEDVKVYVFDWDARHLAATVTIATSTFTIVPLAPSDDTALTKDQESILTGSRKTQVRLTGGTVGAQYRVENKIVTNESPAQTIERSFLLQIEEM